MSNTILCPWLAAAAVVAHPEDYHRTSLGPQECRRDNCQLWSTDAQDCALKAEDKNSILIAVLAKVGETITKIDQTLQAIESLQRDVDHIAEDASFAAESQRME